MPLPPLAWVPDHPVLVTAADVIHRPDCEAAENVTATLAAGESLWRMRAPALCWRCRPDVETRLGHDAPVRAPA